ncbi:hypothetical protein ACIQZN_25205 [Streptomyces sp. NPDC097595]|uniref:hypothetical protein n=1 Tax=Streptomyces sp. NPDC097595 TaxID=3366090 RepID=UPI003829AE0C
MKPLLAALDLATGKIYYRSATASGGMSSSAYSRSCAAAGQARSSTSCWTASPPHKHPNVRARATANEVELVFLPTYGSWPNWIESEFAALRNFALNGTDRRSHGEQNAAIASCSRWRNARAAPKTGFAIESPIRTWTDYPAKAA